MEAFVTSKLIILSTLLISTTSVAGADTSNVSCFFGDVCIGEGTSAASFSECCSISGSGSYNNPITGNCESCSSASNEFSCFLGEVCKGEGAVAASFSDCCSIPGAGSYKNPNTDICEPCSGMSSKADIYGDPHFIVPLLSKELLCYAIQGYSGLAFNLVYNKNFIINAQFVDSIGDTGEATWIGKLAVIPHSSNSSDAIVFDSVDQKVIVVGHGSFEASLIRRIIINEDGRIKFTQGVERQTGNPTVHVSYTNPHANFDVNFHSNHLNVDWNVQYDVFAEIHGLMGQFMGKGVHLDTQKQMLVFSNGQDPVSVTKDSTMTGGTGKECWKAMNFGNQGEGLIIGKILNYVVPHLLSDDLNI